jgi:L-ascorbate metabolism protein UlaG (beta-lactamase superfamily)
MSSLSITWLGHAAFIITTPGGKRIVTDPRPI